MDDGPGLPLELAARLDQPASLRDPPLRRSDGFGGLGLAIAQRVPRCVAAAMLHGGNPRHVAARGMWQPAAWWQPGAAARATGWHGVVPGAAAGSLNQPKRSGNA